MVKASGAPCWRRRRRSPADDHRRFAFYNCSHAAFECNFVVDLPRAQLIAHPHLISDIQTAVVVTELTWLPRDTIRILSWVSQRPGDPVPVVPTVPAGGQLEINRKDFEGSIDVVSISSFL